MARTLMVPVCAVLFPVNLGPFADYQAGIVRATQARVNERNSNEAGKYSSACSAWLIDNTQHRDYGLPLTAKPLAVRSQVMHTVKVEADDTLIFVDGNGGQYTAPSVSAGAMYLWITEDGDPVGPPCADLPAIAVRVAGHVHVGKRLAGSYFVKAADDTYPIDGPPVPAMSDDSVSGLFEPVGSPAGPGQGWWLKVG